MPENYYKILGLNKKATEEEIKTAYKKLALKYHPDTNKNNIVAEEIFKKINEAYQVLSNGDKKRLYDQKLEYGFSFDANSQQKKQGSYHQHSGPAPAPMPTPTIKRTYIYIFIAAIILLSGSYFGIKLIMKNTAVEYYEKARFYYYEEGTTAKALKNLDKAFLNYSELPEANFLYGLILYEKYEEYQRALFYLNRAIEFEDKTKVSSLLQRVKCHNKLNDKLAAERDLKVILKIDPENSEAQILMGEVSLYEHLNYKDSEKHFSNALNNESLNVDLKIEALIGKTVALYKQKKYIKSREYIQRALELKPNNGVAYYYLAFTKLESEKDTIAACNSFYKAASLGVKQADIIIHRVCE